MTKAKNLPIRNRATYSIKAFEAVTVRPQLKMNGNPMRMAVYLRPMRSASRPAGTAPTKAPMARKLAIQDSGNPIKINVIKLEY